MSTNEMRRWLKEDSKYRSAKWSKRIDKMSDVQVFAVYNRLRNEVHTQDDGIQMKMDFIEK